MAKTPKTKPKAQVKDIDDVLGAGLTTANVAKVAKAAGMTVAQLKKANANDDWPTKDAYNAAARALTAMVA